MSDATDRAGSGAPPASDLGDEESEAVLRQCKRAEAFRKASEMQENLDRITHRVEEALSRYRSSSSSKSGTSLEYVDDADQLLGVLSDPKRRKKYQEKVTVVVIGAEESVAKKAEALSSLNEFFSERVEAMKKDPDYNVAEEDLPPEMDDSAYLADDARTHVQSATQRLQDINISYAKLFKIQQAFPDGKKGRKKLEKALLTAQDNMEELHKVLASTQDEVDAKSSLVGSLEEDANRHKQELAVLKDEVSSSRALSFRVKDLEGELRVTQLQLKTAQEKAGNGAHEDAVEDLKLQIEDLEIGLAAERQSRESFHETLVEDHRNEMAAVQSAFEEKMRLVQEQRDRLEDQLKAIAQGEEDISEQDLPGTEPVEELPAVDEDDTAAEEIVAETDVMVDEAGDDRGEADTTEDDRAIEDDAHPERKETQTSTSSPQMKDDGGVGKAKELDDVVKGLRQELAEEKEKTQASKRRLAATKVQLAESDRKMDELSHQLLKLQAIVVSHPAPPTTTHVGAQFPSHPATPSLSRSDVAQSADPLVQESEAVPVQVQSVHEVATQTDSIFTLQPASPTPPPPSHPGRAPLSARSRPVSGQPFGGRPQSSRDAHQHPPATSSIRSKSAHGSSLAEVSLSSSSSLVFSRPVSRSKSARSISDRALAPVSVVTGSVYSTTGGGSVRRIVSEAELPSEADLLARHVESMRDMQMASQVLSADHVLVKEISRINYAIDRFQRDLVDVLNDNGCEEAAADLGSVHTTGLQLGAGMEPSVQHIRSTTVTVLEKAHACLEQAFEQQHSTREKTSICLSKIKQLQEDNTSLKEQLRDMKTALRDKEQLLAGASSPDDRLRRQGAELDHLRESLMSLRLKVKEQQKLLQKRIAGPEEKPLYERPPVQPWFMHFNRLNAKTNERALYGGVFENRINPEEYAEMVLSMREYNRLPVERLQNFARQRLLREAMARNAAYLEAHPSRALLRNSYEQPEDRLSPGAALNSIMARHVLRLTAEADLLDRERNEIGVKLTERLADLQEKSSIFLIRPALTYDPSAPVQKKGRMRRNRPRSQSELSTSTSSLSAVSLPDIPRRYAPLPAAGLDRSVSRTHARAVPPPPTSQAIRPAEEYSDRVNDADRPPRGDGQGDSSAVHGSGAVAGKLRTSPIKLPRLAAAAAVGKKQWSPKSSLPHGDQEYDATMLCRSQLIDSDMAHYSWEQRLVSMPAASSHRQSLREYHTMSRTTDKVLGQSHGESHTTPVPPASSTAEIYQQARSEALERQLLTAKAHVVPTSREARHLITVDGRIPVIMGQKMRKK